MTTPKCHIVLYISLFLFCECRSFLCICIYTCHPVGCFCQYTVEPRYNEVLGTMKITLLYQVSHFIRLKTQRNIKSWDQQNYLVIRGFCNIRPLYNKVPLYLVMSPPLIPKYWIVDRLQWTLVITGTDITNFQYNKGILAVPNFRFPLSVLYRFCNPDITHYSETSL